MLFSCGKMSGIHSRNRTHHLIIMINQKILLTVAPTIVRSFGNLFIVKNRLIVINQHYFFLYAAFPNIVAFVPITEIVMKLFNDEIY